jgi:hypothetical protein
MQYSCERRLPFEFEAYGKIGTRNLPKHQRAVGKVSACGGKNAEMLIAALLRPHLQRYEPLQDGGDYNCRLRR